MGQLTLVPPSSRAGGGNGARIETGSYVGTGTYGSSNPCSLTFGFEPKLVFITGWSGRSSDNRYQLTMQNPAACAVSFADSSQQGTNNLTWTANGVEWYCSYGSSGTTTGTTRADAEGQMNQSDVTYYYVAIG